MIFLALKTEDGRITGKISFYCRMLGISRQGFYKYLANKDRPWKYQDLADAMKEIISEDECNDTYGRIRMYQALLLKQPEGVHIPSERTVYRVMDQIGLSHRPRRKPNGLTKADREAMKSDDLLKRDFHSDAPLEKCITDITEIPACNGKLYVSAIFDCFDLSVLGLSMGTNMKADLCIQTLENALTAYPALEGAIIHSDRGTQYTSESYRQTIREHHIHQSMNSAGGRCHDNARCESMWARMKTELLYDRYDTKQMTVEELKVLIWRYFLSYWNNRRICSANGGLPPMIKRRQYYFATDRDGNNIIHSGINAEARVVSVIRAGIFVDLFGLETYIPLKELSYQRLLDAASQFHTGQRILVKILEVERKNHDVRVLASVKQATENPYEKALRK